MALILSVATEVFHHTHTSILLIMEEFQQRMNTLIKELTVLATIKQECKMLELSVVQWTSQWVKLLNNLPSMKMALYPFLSLLLLALKIISLVSIRLTTVLMVPSTWTMMLLLSAMAITWALTTGSSRTLGVLHGETKVSSRFKEVSTCAESWTAAHTLNKSSTLSLYQWWLDSNLINNQIFNSLAD